MGKYVQGTYTPRNPEKYIGSHVPYYRSSWELRLFRFFDVNEHVLQWASEPFAITYFDPTAQRNRRYFPDFLVIYNNKEGKLIREIIEVKPFVQTQPPKMSARRKLDKYMLEASTYIRNVKKWEAARAVASQRGYTFRIITEKQLNNSLSKG
jgi:hypothetical protein